MKRRNKNRNALLLLAYAVLFIFTLCMEWIAIRDMTMRAVVNLSTLALALFGGTFCALLYRREHTDAAMDSRNRPDCALAAGDSENRTDCTDEPDREQAQRKQERKEQEWIIDKEAYLAFANEKELTRRETEIAFLAVNGYSNQRLAEELYISEATVKKHLTHIYEKTGANGRKALKEAVKNLR